MDSLDKDITVFLEKFNKNLEERMEDIREKIEEDAKDRCPVNTGALRDSIDIKLEKEKEEIKIKINENNLEDYWDEVEFGTSKQQPQPFLRPAIKGGTERIEDALKESLKESGKIGR